MSGTTMDIKEAWGFEEGDTIASGLFALRLLGGGRRYEAYLAHSESLLSTVVVKVVRPDRVDDEATIEGLISEYEAVRSLNHPVILRGYGIDTGPRPHIVLEHMEGPRLSTLLRKFGPLPVEQFMPLAMHLASALHYMHPNGWVHLDLKPSNTIMGAPPRMIDMSIARRVKDAARLRAAVGTDAYMAPEQCLAGEGGTIGPAADVWGLGVMLYEAIAGRLPFDLMDNQRHPQLEQTPMPFMVPVASYLDDLIQACLSYSPEARPTAREVYEGLEPGIATTPKKIVLGRLRPKLR
ncbi:MAG: serine/threonine-protein kinase [Actinomycetota bacterium]